MSDQCQNWHLGHYRDYQGTKLRPLRHAVVIIGFGTDLTTGLSFWKVKNSWGLLWGESGFFRIVKGYGHCGIVAYVAVAQKVLHIWWLPRTLTHLLSWSRIFLYKRRHCQDWFESAIFIRRLLLTDLSPFLFRQDSS